MIHTDPTLTCKLDGCDNKLIGLDYRMKYCCTEHTVKAGRQARDVRIALQKIERAKLVKEAAPRPKRDVNRGGVDPGSVNLIYEDYKEPLKPIEPTEGFGYYGTIAVSRDGMYIQCHICGQLFGQLNRHLASHKTTAAEYKKKFELSESTSLISEEARRNRQVKAVLAYNPKSAVNLTWERPTGGGSKKKRSLEWRNKRGVCPEQLLEKIKELGDQLGRAPSVEEFTKYYGGRYINAIYYVHGTYSKAVRKLGWKTASELKKVDAATLIKSLQDFHKQHGRIPMTSDFSRGLLRDRNTYTRQFGTLNEARIQAGLNAVVPAGARHKWIELSPEQYYAYKNGEGITSGAKEMRHKRRQLRLMEGVA